MTKRVSLVGSAVTAVDRAKTGTIAITGKKGETYVLTAIELQVFGVLTTIVDLGGLVELENDAVTWTPFEFYTNMLSAVTATSSGGAQGKVLRIPVHKQLPAGSNVDIYYTPHNAASQKLSVVLVYEKHMRFNASKETFAISDLGTAADCSGGVEKHIQFSIPSMKGGVCRAVIVGVCGAITTVQNTGGKLELKNKSADPSWEPFEIITHAYTCINNCGVVKEQQFIPCKLDLPDNSEVLGKYTAQHTVNSNLSVVFIYTKK